MCDNWDFFLLIEQIGHLLVYATECDVSLCNFGQIGLCSRMPTKTSLLFLDGVSAGGMNFSPVANMVTDFKKAECICPNC